MPSEDAVMPTASKGPIGSMEFDFLSRPMLCGQLLHVSVFFLSECPIIVHLFAIIKWCLFGRIISAESMFVLQPSFFKSRTWLSHNTPGNTNRSDIWIFSPEQAISHALEHCTNLSNDTSGVSIFSAFEWTILSRVTLGFRFLASAVSLFVVQSRYCSHTIFYSFSTFTRAENLLWYRRQELLRSSICSLWYCASESFPHALNCHFQSDSEMFSSRRSNPPWSINCFWGLLSKSHCPPLRPYERLIQMYILAKLWSPV